MSLRDLNAPTRRRLRRHAWLLTAWCVALGFAASWILLHVFGLRQPAARYGIAAIVMYSLGLVVGTRIWLVHFSQSVRRERGLLGTARPRTPPPSSRKIGTGRAVANGREAPSIWPKAWATSPSGSVSVRRRHC